MSAQSQRTINALTHFVIPVLAAALTIVSISPPAQADDAIRFMQRVKKDLLRAAKTKSQADFHRAITRYADIYRIGIRSLGTYAKNLPKQRRPAYHKGVRKYMSKVLSGESQKYRIAGATIHRPSRSIGKGYREVDTTVQLADSLLFSSVDVTWRLKKTKSGYRIADARLLGVWLTSYQRTAFENYIQKTRGSINALIWALNQ